MKYLLIGAVLVIAAKSPESAGAQTLSIQIGPVGSASGTLRVALFDEEGFQSNRPIAAHAIAASEGTVSTMFEDLSPGNYAIRLFHDLNDNGELDRGLMGRPLEPYGFSNDAPIRFGQPDFDAVNFLHGPGGSEISITLR